jgi:hypothetical protein
MSRRRDALKVDKTGAASEGAATTVVEATTESSADAVDDWADV